MWTKWTNFDKLILMTTFADNLALVRDRLGMSQKAAATRMGISSSLVSKWEKGERTPDEAQLWELARIYGVDPAFLREGARAVTFQPRSMVARKSDEKQGLGAALNDAAAQIHSLHTVWELAREMPRRLSLTLEYSEPRLTELAAMVRRFLGLNERVTYTELCQSLAENSVQVFEWKLPPKLSGLSHQRDFSVIFVNRDMPERVKLFTVCHELAHLLFHLRGEEDTAVSLMATRNDPHEKEANRFAAELLMPLSKVDDLIRRQGTKLRSKAGFLAAVDHFGVSHGAMFYRLVQRQVVSYTEKARFFTEVPRHETEREGARVSGAGGRRFEDQVPPRLLELATALWLTGKASIGKVAAWCTAGRTCVEKHLSSVAEDGDEAVNDVDLGYAEVEGLEA